MSYENLTIKLLKTFRTVALLKNHTKAAEQLNITQPAVTKQIKHLESILGLELFSYKNRELHLTNATKILIPEIDKVLVKLENLTSTIENCINNSPQGAINLGVISSAQYIVLDMIDKFCNWYPNIKVNLMFMSFNDTLIKLRSRKIDFALTGGLVDDSDIDIAEYKSYKFCFVAPSSYKDLSNKTLTIADLIDKKKVLNEKGSFSRSIMTELFDDNQLLNAIEISNNNAIIKAVINGLGIALVPEFMITDDIKGKVQILNVKNLSLYSSLNLISLNDRELSQMEQIFKNLCAKNPS